MYSRFQTAMTRVSRHPYTRLIGLLLLTTLAITGVLLTSWCSDCDNNANTSPNNSRTAGNPPEGNPYIGGDQYILNPPVLPGSHATRVLRVSFTSNNPGTVRYEYTPPPGATDFQFPDRPPDRVDADGTMIWDNVYANLDTGSYPGINLTYNMPALPQGTSQMNVTETFSAVTPGGTELSSDRVTNIRESKTSQAAAALPPQTVREDAVSQSSAYYLWATENWLGVPGLAMTTSVCQQWMDFLQEGSAFVAVRFPLLTATDAATYTLPVAMRAGYFPSLSLMNESGGLPTEVLSAPLAVRPKYHTFLANELPQAEGERWVALGAATETPVVCPAGLNLAAGNWEFLAKVWLDFGGAQDACDGCTLSAYVCYEGQDAPGAVAALSLLAGPRATTYQGWGITCVGPGAVPLNDYFDPGNVLYLESAHTAVISPTERVTLHHALQNFGSTAVTVNLTYSSTQGITYDFYKGSWDAPQMPLQTLTLPLTVQKNHPVSFWVIGQAPADAQGAETLTITARSTTNPSVSAWVSDLVWIGEWEPPPQPPAVQYRVHLPVVMRQ